MQVQWFMFVVTGIARITHLKSLEPWNHFTLVRLCDGSGFRPGWVPERQNTGIYSRSSPCSHRLSGDNFQQLWKVANFCLPLDKMDNFPQLIRGQQQRLWDRSMSCKKYLVYEGVFGIIT